MSLRVTNFPLAPTCLIRFDTSAARSRTQISACSSLRKRMPYYRYQRVKLHFAYVHFGTDTFPLLVSFQLSIVHASQVSPEHVTSFWTEQSLECTFRLTEQLAAIDGTETFLNLFRC